MNRRSAVDGLCQRALGIIKANKAKGVHIGTLCQALGQGQENMRDVLATLRDEGLAVALVASSQSLWTTPDCLESVREAYEAEKLERAREKSRRCRRARRERQKAARAAARRVSVVSDVLKSAARVPRSIFEMGAV